MVLRLQNRRENLPLIFLHVPKTAGMSVRRIMQKIFPGNQLHSHNPPLQYADMATFDASGIRGVLGHFHLGQPEVGVPMDKNVFTFVRDPLARIASDYFYQKAYFANPAVNHDLHVREALESTSTISDYVQKVRIWWYDNIFVRMFTHCGYLKPFGQVTAEHLDLAVANLKEHVFFIGRQEQFDHHFRQLCLLLGWPWEPQKENVGRYAREKIPYGDVDALRKINCFDLELYERICRDEL